MGRSQPRPPARTPAPGFPSSPAHARPRTHAHTEQQACLHQEKLCLELKLACVNYSDNDFARYIWAGPPCPFPAAHPPLWAAGPSPHPHPRPSGPCWQPLSQPLSRLIGSQMYFKYHSAQRQLLKTLSSHCRWARAARLIPHPPPRHAPPNLPPRPDPGLSLPVLPPGGPALQTPKPDLPYVHARAHGPG